MKASPVLRSAGTKAGRDSAKWVRSLTEAMHACSGEVAVYGECLTVSLPNIKHKGCEEQFRMVEQCFKQQLKQGKLH